MATIMSTVINLDEKRSKRKSNPRQEGSLLKRSVPNPDTKFNGAFSIFVDCSSLGKERQLDFLYEILCKYYFKRRPISFDEMAEMMLSYLCKNKRYFEKITGNPWPYDFDGELNLKEMSKRINFSVKRVRKPT
jgi:hypothetical protein